MCFRRSKECVDELLVYDIVNRWIGNLGSSCGSMILQMASYEWPVKPMGNYSFEIVALDTERQGMQPGAR